MRPVRTWLGRLARVTLTAVALVVASATSAQDSGEPPRGQAPTRIDLTVTVTAEQARRMNDAVNVLQRAGDPFVSYLARPMILLADAMARQSERTFTIGPLTDREQAILPLAGYLGRHQDEQGPIRIEFKTSWSTTAPRIYRFDQGRFLTLLAAIARGPLLQVPARHHEQLLFVGRAVLDFNQQSGGAIPQRQILGALANACNDKRLGERLAAVVMALRDDPAIYDLVPPIWLEALRKHDATAFLPASSTASDVAVQIVYAGRVYTTSVDALIWWCLRFLAGDSGTDWVEHSRARSRRQLGGAVVEYLELQTQFEAMNRLSDTLRSSVADRYVALGDYRVDHPVVMLLKKGPGVVETDESDRIGYISLFVLRANVPDLTHWLAETQTALMARLAVLQGTM